MKINFHTSPSLIIMEKESCEICAFKNPKATSTAIIIQNNKLLLLKRNQEPFLGLWDLPGGFLQKNEIPKEALKRELEEELNVNVVSFEFIKTIAGSYQWKEKNIPILDHFYLTEISGDIILDPENSELAFVDLKTLSADTVAFESGKKMVAWLKEHFTFDLERVKELIHQLDSSATMDEQYLYKAILDGFISKVYDEGKLIGMGWIFPRQTALRKQAVVEDMIVDNAYRGKGYGEKILLELLDWARKEDMDTIELTTNPARVAANALYQKVGFQLHPTNHYLYFVKNK